MNLKQRSSSIWIFNGGKILKNPHCLDLCKQNIYKHNMNLFHMHQLLQTAECGVTVPFTTSPVQFLSQGLGL